MPKSMEFNANQPLTTDNMNALVQDSQIVQATGDSTTDVMSQKAVTDELNKKMDKSALNGSQNSSPTFYAPTSAGTSGTVLKSSGSGAPTWVSPSTLSVADAASARYYGTCATAASTAAKTASCTGFVLQAGATIGVKMSYAHSSGTAATLNVNNTGAKTIYTAKDYQTVSVSTANTWKAGELCYFQYDGANWYWLNNRQVAPTSAGSSGQILISNGTNTPTWVSGTTGQDTVTSGGSIGNSNYFRFITVWAEETTEYGTLYLRKNNNANGVIVAEAHGENGYWGKNMLCISACFAKGDTAYVVGSKVGTINYSCVELR